MTRWLFGLTFMLFTVPAVASPEKREAPATPTTVKEAAADKDPATERDEFQLDAESEVLLNGQPTRYEDVPANAIIQRMQVTRDGVVVRVHFRTR
jgi:hypothetical protein